MDERTEIIVLALKERIFTLANQLWPTTLVKDFYLQNGRFHCYRDS